MPGQAPAPGQLPADWSRRSHFAWTTPVTRTWRRTEAVLQQIMRRRTVTFDELVWMPIAPTLWRTRIGDRAYEGCCEIAKPT